MLEMQALLPTNLETQTTRVLHSLKMEHLETGKVLNKKERFEVSCDIALNDRYEMQQHSFAFCCWRY